MNNQVMATAKFDRALISEGGDSIRYLLVELKTPPMSANREQSPLNIALVIDSSRSMTGSRLRSAKEAAVGIIDSLSEYDYVSVVSFSDTAIVHLDGVRCTRSGKESALAAVDSIVVRAGTNLSEGWFKGAECVGKVMLDQPNHKNHVLILSDGHANLGTLEPVALSHHANELQIRRVTASAVGIGDGYSTAQLYSLAQYGGGRVHHAAHPPEIVEVVYGELLELRNRCIENLKVTINFSEDVVCKSLNIMPVEFNIDSACCIFGGLSHGSSRTAIFRVATPEGKKNEELKIQVNYQWRNSGDSTVSTGNPVVAALKFADPVKNSLQPVDDDTAIHVARLWQSWVVWEATNLNRVKNYTKLDRLLANELKYFRRFCKVIPQACVLLNELVQLSHIANQDWDEASRKEIQSSTYTTLYGLTDTRSGSRKKRWQDYTGEFTKM